MRFSIPIVVINLFLFLIKLFFELICITCSGLFLGGKHSKYLIHDPTSFQSQSIGQQRIFLLFSIIDMSIEIEGIFSKYFY